MQKTSTLPAVRVPADLRRKAEQVAASQELSLAEVIRAALEEYCTPLEQGTAKVVRVPIVGEIQNNQVVWYPNAKKFFGEAA